MSDRSLMYESPGLPLVISAPSGTGKTTLARRLLKSQPDALFSISYTTRSPRGSERDGVDYHFVDRTTFNTMVEDGAFVEWARVHGENYGTLRSDVERSLQQGKIVIFDIDVQGGEQVREAYTDAVSVLIAPPSMCALEQRLRSRSTDRAEVIARRLSVARDEMIRAAKTYDYLIINDDLDVAARQFEAIAVSERCRLERINRSKWVEDL